MSYSFIFREAVQGGGWEPRLWSQAGQLQSQRCAHLTLILWASHQNPLILFVKWDLKLQPPSHKLTVMIHEIPGCVWYPAHTKPSVNIAWCCFLEHITQCLARNWCTVDVSCIALKWSTDVIQQAWKEVGEKSARGDHVSTWLLEKWEWDSK